MGVHQVVTTETTRAGSWRTAEFTERKPSRGGARMYKIVLRRFHRLDDYMRELKRREKKHGRKKK